MAEAKFTRGPTMRHVAVMTATGGVGLVWLFLVDALNLFYISLLGQRELAAAIGFAGTVQFFMISISIGLSIAATALISRSIGAGEGREARRLAASSLVVLVALLSVAAALVWLGRDWALGLLGATGETRQIAGRFLAMVLPSVPVLGLGMVSGGLLRAAGDARRAMMVTLSAGAVAAVLDPILIFGLGLGLDGAAIALVVMRIILAGIGLGFAIGVHDLVGRIDPRATLGDARQILAIAIPAVATQLSTPFGNAFLTGTVAVHGDAAVAGWAVVGRLTALAFGGIFALSGAVGPIFGQNLGAGLFDRIRSAYRDALIFATGYVLVAWALLWIASPWIVAGFGLSGAGSEVFRAFAAYGAGAFVFIGALFVANASFNNLGRAPWSTAFNWTRDGIAVPLLAVTIGGAAGPAGAVLIRALSGLLIGTVAAITAWRFVVRLDRAAIAAAAPVPSVAEPAFASGRAALAQLTAEESPHPLSEDEERR